MPTDTRADLLITRAAAFRAARQAQGLSQSAAADALDVSPRSLQSWERAVRSIPAEIREWVVAQWGADPSLAEEACPHCGRG